MLVDKKHIAVSDSLVHQLKNNRYLDRLQEISDSELCGITSRILEDCAAWTHGRAERLLDCRDFLANACFALSIPIVELAYALYVLRDELQEPEASRFFDKLALELMRRY